MKTKLILSALMFMSSIAFAQSEATKTTIYEGTVISVKLLQDVSSKTNMAGDIIEFETAEPIILNDKVVFNSGLKVQGRVLGAEKAKGAGKAGQLTFSVDYLTLPDNRIIRLTSEQGGKAKSTAGTAVAGAVLLTPLFLFKKGKQMKFDKGQVFKVFVAKDFEV